MQLLNLNPETGVIVRGVMPAVFDQGGISIPGLLPEAGILVMSGEQHRMLLFSRECPPDLTDGLVHRIELGYACVGQEWINGEQPKVYHVLRAPKKDDGHIMFAIPIDPERPFKISVLRHHDGDQEWVKATAPELFPAPRHSGEALAVGTAYAFCTVDSETRRLEMEGADWVFHADPIGRYVTVQNYIDYLEANHRAAEAMGPSGMGDFRPD